MTDALTTLSLLVLAQNFRGDIVDQINRSVQLLKFLPIVAGEGKNVAWAAEGDATLSENYAEGADAANFGGDTQDPATLQWGLYRANFHASKLSMDAAASSASPIGNRMKWVALMKKHCAALAASLNAAAFNGAGTGTTWAGLDVAIGDDANTYANIDRGTKTYWRPTVVDPGSATAPTLSQLRDDVRLVYEASGENPDVAFCAPAVFNAIGSLFDATRRQVEVTVGERGKVTLQAGFHAIELDGMPIVMDKDATKTSTYGTIYYLNTAHVQVQYLPDAEQDKMLRETGLKVKADDGYGEVPLGFCYEKLAKTGASDKAMITSTAQLVVTRPNACGVRKHVGF